MTKKNELNIEQIKNLIPHRYPFLLIDKVIDIVPHKSATGIKNVTFNENLHILKQNGYAGRINY